ncbi:DUF1127 domain-containing protein [Spiribacter halobius]|uniref:YjiS-like domain-containing protein n=1 Tax=Sediminicurvatus halobius TaxID=2182432 RepID=A0A2U2MW51_9GAMM|nr:hypothetical protein DEM34_18635 [Spiribacter halobius]
MSYMQPQRTRQAASSTSPNHAFAGIKRAIRYPLEWLRLYREFLRGRRELLALSERELLDAGLSPEVVYRHTYSFRLWLKDTQAQRGDNS